MGQVADIVGKYVLVVEDMYDSGKTIRKLRETLVENGASKVEVCVAFHTKN